MVTQITSAKDFRRKNEFVLVVDDDLTVRMRRLDLTTLMMNGLVPLPMVRAAQNFEAVQQDFEKADEADKGKKAVDVIEELKDKGFIGTLKRFAVLAVIEPKIVAEPSNNEDEIPVEFLTMNQLLTIWNAGKEGGPNVLTDAQADEFRRTATAVPGADEPARDEVRSETQLVDYVEREAISV